MSLLSCLATVLLLQQISSQCVKLQTDNLHSLQTFLIKLRGKKSIIKVAEGYYLYPGLRRVISYRREHREYEVVTYDLKDPVMRSIFNFRVKLFVDSGLAPFQQMLCMKGLTKGWLISLDFAPETTSLQRFLAVKPDSKYLHAILISVLNFFEHFSQNGIVIANLDESIFGLSEEFPTSMYMRNLHVFYKENSWMYVNEDFSKLAYRLSKGQVKNTKKDSLLYAKVTINWHVYSLLNALSLYIKVAIQTHSRKEGTEFELWYRFAERCEELIKKLEDGSDISLDAIAMFVKSFGKTKVLDSKRKSLIENGQEKSFHHQKLYRGDSV